MSYHLLAMNSTVIHGISATLFFLSESEVYTSFPGNSKFEKQNSLSANQNSISVFDLTEREFCFSNLELPGKEVKTSLSDKKQSGGNTVYYGRIHR